MEKEAGRQENGVVGAARKDKQTRDRTGHSLYREWRAVQKPQKQKLEDWGLNVFRKSGLSFLTCKVDLLINDSYSVRLCLEESMVLGLAQKRH